MFNLPPIFSILFKACFLGMKLVEISTFFLSSPVPKIFNLIFFICKFFYFVIVSNLIVSVNLFDLSSIKDLNF